VVKLIRLADGIVRDHDFIKDSCGGDDRPSTAQFSSALMICIID
jgi:hypothetical protein